MKKSYRERLAERLQKEFGIEIDPTTWRTTHAGPWQLAAGAASSIVRLKNGVCECLFYGPLRDYFKNGTYLSLWQDFPDIHVNWEWNKFKKDADCSSHQGSD